MQEPGPLGKKDQVKIKRFHSGEWEEDNMDNIYTKLYTS